MAKKDHAASGSTIAGAGAVTAGTGLVAGGVPGARSNASGLKNTGTGARRVFRSDSSGNPPAAKAAPGGIFGYRHAAHKGYTDWAKEDAAHHAKTDAGSRVNHFLRGRGEGKIAPEETIMRHMKMGRRGATAALVGGSAAAVYGVKRQDEVKKARRDVDSFNGALLGGGAATAAVGGGGAKVLGSQSRKWAQRATEHQNQASKLVPNLANRTDDAVQRSPKLLAGKSNKTAEQAGRLRGHATQEKYFSRVYGTNAKMFGRMKNPGLAAAGVGAAGLALSRKKDKGISKNMSAFGVEH